MTFFLVFFGILAAIVFWAIGIYNRLVNQRNRVRNAFAQIDVQLTRRYDLIPNLIEAVKGYMKHERETLEAVIVARKWVPKSAFSCGTRMKQKACGSRKRSLNEARKLRAGNHRY